MKNNIKLLYLFLLISTNAFCSNNFFNWLYLTSLPIIFGQMTITARVNAAKQFIKDKDKLSQSQNQIKIEDQSKTNESKIINKQKFKDLIEKKCLLCQAMRNVLYFTLLTYGSTINFLQGVSNNDPGSLLNITFKPIINASIMYLISYFMDKRVRDELLNN